MMVASNACSYCLLDSAWFKLIGNMPNKSDIFYEHKRKKNLITNLRFWHIQSCRVLSWFGKYSCDGKPSLFRSTYSHVRSLRPPFFYRHSLVLRQKSSKARFMDQLIFAQTLILKTSCEIIAGGPKACKNGPHLLMAIPCLNRVHDRTSHRCLSDLSMTFF